MGWDGFEEALGGRLAAGFFCSRSDTEEKPAALDMPARMPVAARPRFCIRQHSASGAQRMRGSSVKDGMVQVGGCTLRVNAQVQVAGGQCEGHTCDCCNSSEGWTDLPAVAAVADVPAPRAAPARHIIDLHAGTHTFHQHPAAQP